MSATADRRDAVIAILRAVRDTDTPADGGDAWSALNDRFHEIEALYEQAPDPLAIENRPRGGGHHGPEWRARITTDIARHGLVVEAGRSFDDGRFEHLTGFAPVHGVGQMVVEVVDGQAYPQGGGIAMPQSFADALYRALSAHFGGTLDARTARADFEFSRAQHGQLVGDLVALANRVADVASAAAARSNVTVFGAADVVNPGSANPGSVARSFTYGPGATVAPNPPRPDDLPDTRR